MDSELRTKIMAFRVPELETLLAYAGKNKTGRKNELQARALELIKTKPIDVHIVTKIRELYRSIQYYNTALPTLNEQTPSSSHQQNTQLSSGFVSTVVDNSNPGAVDPFLEGYIFDPSMTITVTHNVLPICPDVKLKRLPFYDILSELIQPTSLIPHGNSRTKEAYFSFCLTPNQAADVASSKELNRIIDGQNTHDQYGVQVQLRFCLVENNVDQDDLFPPSILVKVNGEIIPLPDPIEFDYIVVEPKIPSVPLNVTNFVNLSPTCTNQISVYWVADSSKGYALSLFLVRKLSSSDLLNRIKAKGIKPRDYTVSMIKEILTKDYDDCIATASLTVSIACPLGKSRMVLPCRAINCLHLQCFDANLYLQMNEKKSTWNCPVCNKSLLFEDLAIDGYFHEVINKVTTKDTGGTSNDIKIYPDGTWVSQVSKAKNESDGPSAKKSKTESNNKTICLDDEVLSDDEPKKTTTSKKNGNEIEVEVVDLTVSDPDEDEENIKPVERSNTTIKNDNDSSSPSTGTGPEIRAIPLPKAPQQQQKQEASSSPPIIITLDDDSDLSPRPTPGPSSRANENASASTTNSTQSSASTSNYDSQSQNLRPTPPLTRYRARAAEGSAMQVQLLPITSSSALNQFLHLYSTTMNSNWAPYRARTAQPNNSNNEVRVTIRPRMPTQLPTQPQQQAIVPNPPANNTNSNPDANSSTNNTRDSNNTSTSVPVQVILESLDWNAFLINIFGANPNTGPR